MVADKSRKSRLFDPEALLDAQRRNFQALANAGNIVADGMRSYAERQVTMVQESMGHLWGELQSMGKRAPAAPTDQLERMRSAFEKVVAQVQDLGNHMLEVQRQAVSVLNECASKNLEVLGSSAPELAALQQKAKSAFEHASQQTSAVIDEMKRRMESLEHETISAVGGEPVRPAPPKPAAQAAAPAPPKPAAPRAAPAKAKPPKAPAPKKASPAPEPSTAARAAAGPGQTAAAAPKARRTTKPKSS